MPFRIIINICISTACNGGTEYSSVGGQNCVCDETLQCAQSTEAGCYCPDSEFLNDSGMCQARDTCGGSS